jgi:hypothetical protein
MCYLKKKGLSYVTSIRLKAADLKVQWITVTVGVIVLEQPAEHAVPAPSKHNKEEQYSVNFCEAISAGNILDKKDFFDIAIQFKAAADKKISIEGI